MDTSQLMFPKGSPRVLVKDRKRAAAETALAKAYEAVNLRDENRCRVTGVHLSPAASEATRRREHHHLVKRSQSKTKVADPSNIILVSAYAHELIEKHVLLPLGTGPFGLTFSADKPLKFVWNRNLILRGREPFRLRPSVNGERIA